MATFTESPYLGWPGRPRLSLWNQLVLGLLWFPNNVLWTGLLLIVMPEKVLAIVGPHQATGVLSWTNIVGVGVAILFAPIFGALSDSWRSSMGRRRPMIVLGTVPAAACLLILAYAPSIPLFVVGLVGIQLFNNFAQGAYQGLIPDLVPHEQRGAASGYMGFYNQLGVIVGGVLGAFVAPVVFAWSVLAGMLAALGITVGAVKEPPSLDLPRPDWGDKIRSFLVRGEAYRDFRWVWVTRIVVLTGLYVLEQYLLYYLKFVLGVPNPKTEVFLLLVILSATALIAALVSGYVSDRLRKRRLIVSLAGILQGICALLFVVSHSVTMIEVAAAIFGLGYGAYQAVDWALVIDTLPAGSAAKDMGVWAISTTGAQLLALLMGFVLAQAVIPLTGIADAYRLLFAATALFFAVGSVLIWQVRRVA